MAKFNKLSILGLLALLMAAFAQLDRDEENALQVQTVFRLPQFLHLSRDMSLCLRDSCCGEVTSLINSGWFC